MILLRRDCLVFKNAQGEQFPCSAQEIAIELIGASLEPVDPEMIKNAAHAVLHYFKTDLERTTVSVEEFSEALEKVLRRLGLDMKLAYDPEPPAPDLELDLCELARASGESGELFFLPRLREELRRHLRQSPRVVRFRGLSGCVQQLTGAKRWTRHCQGLRDQIVEYLRNCLSIEQKGRSCALVVS